MLTGAGTVNVGTGPDDLNLNSGTVQGSLTINGDVDVDEGLLTGQTIVDGNVDLGEGTVAGEVTVTGALSGPSIDDNAGTISPGNSPGTITAGDLILTPADTVEIEIDGNAGAGVAVGHDVINVIAGGGVLSGGGGLGTVDLGGATLDLSSAVATLPIASSHTIIENDGTDAVLGTFAGLAEGDLVTLAGRTFTITYQGGDGNDVVLFQTAIIEFTGDTSEAENALITPAINGPTLAVLGDLRNLTVAQRTIDFATPISTSVGPSGAGADIGTPGTDATSINLTIVLPADDYSNAPAFFDLLELGNIVINDDGLVEGPEDFEISNITPSALWNWGMPMAIPLPIRA